MTHELGIITAFAATALLAWLVALLQPQWLPAAGKRRFGNPWREMALFALAMAGLVGMGFAHAQGWLLADAGPWASAANYVIRFLPIAIYLAIRRDLAALFIPRRGVLRSAAVGTIIGLVALLAYFLVRNTVTEAPEILAQIFTVQNVGEAVGLVLQDLAIAGLIAVVADGWSRRISLLVAMSAFFLLHIPIVVNAGMEPGEIIAVITSGAVVAGMLSAVLVTRNVVWFLPVHLLLSLAPLT